MALLNPTHRAALLANARKQAAARERDTELDLRPVVRLFTPDAGCIWLLTELDPLDEDRAFGLCDLGLGEPELGYVRISDLERVRGRFGLAVEADKLFWPHRRLSECAKAAAQAGRIVD